MYFATQLEFIRWAHTYTSHFLYLTVVTIQCTSSTLSHWISIYCNFVYVSVAKICYLAIRYILHLNYTRLSICRVCLHLAVLTLNYSFAVALHGNFTSFTHWFLVYGSYLFFFALNLRAALWCTLDVLWYMLRFVAFVNAHINFYKDTNNQRVRDTERSNENGCNIKQSESRGSSLVFGLEHYYVNWPFLMQVIWLVVVVVVQRELESTYRETNISRKTHTHTLFIVYH